MHRLLFALALTACGSAQAKGPAWPAPSETAEDGGESLAPRPSATYSVAVEKSADGEAEKPADETAGSATEPDEEKPATTPATSQPTIEEVFMTDDLIIEVEEE